MTAEILNRLRNISMMDQVQPVKPEDQQLLQEWHASGIRFAASGGQIEATYFAAVEKLLACILPMGDNDPILQEGGIYLGCWLESTGTINAEPAVSPASICVRNNVPRICQAAKR